MKELILFKVSHGSSHVFTYAFEREGAKRNAHHWLGGNIDNYIVTPLTNTGDKIHLDITLYA